MVRIIDNKSSRAKAIDSFKLAAKLLAAISLAVEIFNKAGARKLKFKWF